MTSPLVPDAEQERVLAHETGAMLVTGGPGTGKTAVLRERFARLLEAGADPERVALVVGSRRAHAEARDALLARFPGSLPELRVVTIHGLARHVVNARFRRLDYPEPPDLLPAGEQFALVQDLLSEQDPETWPAYGHMLGMRAFADQVRQFLSRAQEALLTPEDIRERAEKAGLSGWSELARFTREYLDVIDDKNVVDFAALLQRAAAVAGDGEPLLDHLLVDDHQDSTLAAEAIVEHLAVPSLVVAGDPDAHVFSFQGTTDVPIRRFTERFPGAKHVELRTSHPPRRPSRSKRGPRRTLRRSTRRSRANSAGSTSRRAWRGASSRWSFAVRAHTSDRCCARWTTPACRARSRKAAWPSPPSLRRSPTCSHCGEGHAAFRERARAPPASVRDNDRTCP